MRIAAFFLCVLVPAVAVPARKSVVVPTITGNVAVVDLEKAKAFTVDWGVDQAGPTDLALIP